MKLFPHSYLALTVLLSECTVPAETTTDVASTDLVTSNPRDIQAGPVVSEDGLELVPCQLAAGRGRFVTDPISGAILHVADGGKSFELLQP